MGSLTLYAIKSSLTLALLYLPYALLMRRDTLFRMNRAMLLTIVALSLTVPCLDLHIWDNTAVAAFEARQEALREITLPALVVAPLSSSSEGGELARNLLHGGGWLVALYITGMLAVVVWKTVGLVRLTRFIPSGCLWTDRKEGATIYCHAGRVSPFSWMQSIVVGEEVQGPVMEHELAHVRLGHSWDILLLSAVEALQWFNPCVWMLDASLREVHEYEADDAVLRRGISAREYQLLLIEKAVAQSRYPMVNSFNHSLLKNRITMMTKPRTSQWARLKVLYAVPLTLLAVGAFASQEFTKKVEAPIVPQTGNPAPVVQQEQIPASADNKPLHIKPGTLRLVVDGREMTVQEAMNAVRGKEIQNTVMPQPDGSTELQITTSAPDEKIYDKPEVLPEFPGGMNEFFGWMNRNIQYPPVAQEHGAQGRICVEFVVEKDGSITHIKEVKGVGDKGEIVVTAYKAKDDSSAEVKKENEDKGRIALQEEAKRMVKAMPKWTPGTIGGKPVRTKFVLPVMFHLN